MFDLHPDLTMQTKESFAQTQVPHLCQSVGLHLCAAVLTSNDRLVVVTAASLFPESHCKPRSMLLGSASKMFRARIKQRDDLGNDPRLPTLSCLPRVKPGSLAGLRRSFKPPSNRTPDLAIYPQRSARALS